MVEKLHRAFMGKNNFYLFELEEGDIMSDDRVMSFQWPHGEVSVELEAWGGEDLSVGELVWLTEEEPSSAAGSGHGGLEAGAEDKGPGADD